MVVGFIIIAGLIVYLIISLVVVFLGVRYARKKVFMAGRVVYLRRS